MSFIVEPVAFVTSQRPHAKDDFWGGERAEIVLRDALPESALDGLKEFSHVEVLFVFHEVPEAKIVTGARHPRNNTNWPAVGVFAQRGKNRPNRIGSTICRLLEVCSRTLIVSELDAINGTPVLDIKPVMKEFLPRHETRQPSWACEIMQRYWLVKENDNAA